MTTAYIQYHIQNNRLGSALDALAFEFSCDDKIKKYTREVMDT